MGGFHLGVREEGGGGTTFLHPCIPDKPGVYRRCEELFPRGPTEERLAAHDRAKEAVPDSLTKHTLKISVLF